MKKGKLSTILLVVIFLLGLSVLLYPAVSNYVNQFHASHAIANYDEVLDAMPKEEYDAILSSAEEYNRRLSYGQFQNGEAIDPDYVSQLNVAGNGMMGYVEIRKLGVSLPVYHGTPEHVLQEGAGHLEGSSLPIGGANTHAVITGHRGLPTAKLFTDLDRLETGDEFTISIMDEVLTYEVDDISIVLPEDVSKLELIPGGDYVTLVTCTPYAVNTHRLLVRGVRVEGRKILRVAADAAQIDPLLVAPVVAAPILFVLLIVLLVNTGNKHAARPRKERAAKKRKRGGKNEP